MTNTTPADGTILKTDVPGRVKTPQERREALLDEFEQSGLTGQKFAAVVGIKYQIFATWAQQGVNKEQGVSPRLDTGWVDC